MLDINWGTILWEVINFLVITVVLYFLVFKPMTKRAEARALEKAAAKAELEANLEESAVKLAEIEDRLANLDKEIQDISDEAYANSQTLQKELLDATRGEAERIMLDAVQEARKEHLVDVRENQTELVDTILTILRDVLQKVIPPSVHDKLLEELTTNIWNLGRTDMSQVQRIRESLAERHAVVELTLPKAMTAEQYPKVYNAFNALTDADVELRVDIDEDLIAGAKARIGDIILDNSVLAQILGMREDVCQELEMKTINNND
ncbi:MAG: F0F1 ATP synthase subunit delta [Anaerolineaceae bacterium]|jgi:F-type H+-transporting ATPase subunit b